jgi:CDP-6-deoxy-D-xylo-4-hexulose-3-dehydrase
MSKINHYLMENNITKEDRFCAAKFLLNGPTTLTQGRMVKKFEEQWSKWLGVKYSVFVNSGSSANFLTFACLKILNKEGNVIVPALTWNSDIVSIIKNNYSPDFVDINLRTLAGSEDQILEKLEKKKNKILFISHIQGFNGLTEKILQKIKRKKIILIEDVCESHGATFKNKKLGTFGLISNFSFYYSHHLTTIEGGMICTNNKEIYEICRMLRGHGLAREVSNKKLEKKIIKMHPKVSPKFIFLYPGFNMRNNEINAIIGLNQLPRLNENIKKRSQNLIFFLSNIDKKKYFTDFEIKGNSNYAFPIILKTTSFKKRDKFEKSLKILNIEFRRGNAGGGNQLRQPYLKEYLHRINIKQFKNVEHVHNFGYYIGNFPSLSKKSIVKIYSALNKIIL